MGNSLKERLAQLALAASVGGNAAADPPKAPEAATAQVQANIRLAAEEQNRAAVALQLAAELSQKLKTGAYVQLTPELAANYSELVKQAAKYGGDASMPIYLDREDVGRVRFRITMDSKGKPFMIVSDAAHKQTNAFIEKYVPTHLTDDDLAKLTPAEGTDFSPRVLKAYAALSKKQGLDEMPKIYVDNGRRSEISESNDSGRLALAEAWLTDKNRKVVIVNRAFIREPEDAQLAILAHENDHLLKNRFSVSDFRDRHNKPAVSIQMEQEADQAGGLTCRPHAIAETFRRAETYLIEKTINANPGMAAAEAKGFVERVVTSGPSASPALRQRIAAARALKENQSGCIGVERENPAPDLRDTLVPRGR